MVIKTMAVRLHLTVVNSRLLEIVFTSHAGCGRPGGGWSYPQVQFTLGHWSSVCALLIDICCAFLIQHLIFILLSSHVNEKNIEI